MLPLVAMYENQVIPQKALKQSFNINQAKTSTITHQSNTINHQIFQIKLIKLTIN